MDFQNRCRKLPKALKEWPAFHALKGTIDDFNDMVMNFYFIITKIKNFDLIH